MSKKIVAIWLGVSLVAGAVFSLMFYTLHAPTLAILEAGFIAFATTAGLLGVVMGIILILKRKRKKELLMKYGK